VTCLEYYDAIERAREENDSAKFIEYTLSALYASVQDQIKLQGNTTSKTVPSDVVNDVLNKTEAAVLEFLEKDPSITAEKLAVLISKSEKTAKRNLASLKTKGYIERDGSDKTGQWKIVKE
jgi:predicted HTH transcriptional regulator